MEKITYGEISSIGMELLRKNNDNFIATKLSEQMERIFIAANKDQGVREIKNETYRKSGMIPGRVYYINTDQVKNKIYDIVTLNDEDCVWLYTNNAIDKIGEDPVNTITDIYDTLLSTFKCPLRLAGFNRVEYRIIGWAATILLFNFLYESYGSEVIDIEKCKKDMIKKITNLTPRQYTNDDFDTIIIDNYTEESKYKFIDHVIANSNIKRYFINREYLNSYMLLEDLERKYDPMKDLVQFCNLTTK